MPIILGGLIVAGAIGLVVAASVLRGSRRRYRGRRRRYGRETKNSKNNLSGLLEMVRAQDVTGCGRRLMCELAAIPEDIELPELARDILELVGPAVRPGEGVLPPGATGEYLEAKSYGHYGGNCGQKYFTCPEDGRHLLGMVLDQLQ
ncbi:uncharacterized protein [Procambarus clarkii]|uniref:uncharacterized protein n=1 Tax=Procambarus clarkii TaxID=6728 RepID=UPI0037449398